MSVTLLRLGMRGDLWMCYVGSAGEEQGCDLGLYTLNEGWSFAIVIYNINIRPMECGLYPTVASTLSCMVLFHSPSPLITDPLFILSSTSLPQCPNHV